MATQAGRLVLLRFSTDGGTTQKVLVCETENSFEGTTSITSTETKCDDGTAVTAAGAIAWTFNGSGVVKTDPGAAEASYNDLGTWWKAKTRLHVEMSDTADNINQSGYVYITTLNLTNPVSGNSNFSVTLTGDGDITFA